MADRPSGLLMAGLLAVLLAVAPRPGAALELLAGPVDQADPTGPVLAVIGLLAWASAGWLSFGAALVAAGRLPGISGRLAAAGAGRVLPAAVRRSLEVSLGASLVIGTIGASPATAATIDPGPPVTSSRVLPGAAALSLDWPVSRSAVAPPGPTGSAAPAAGVLPTAAPFPAPATVPSASSTPVAATPVAPTPVTSTPSSPAAPLPGPASPPPVWRAPVSPTAAERTTPPDADPAAVRPSSGSTVVVQPGDTLWDLAARELTDADIAPSDAHVAARWPAWWAANRASIGDDPHLLRPGTALTPPVR